MLQENLMSSFGSWLRLAGVGLVPVPWICPKGHLGRSVGETHKPHVDPGPPFDYPRVDFNPGVVPFSQNWTNQGAFRGTPPVSLVPPASLLVGFFD